MRSNAKTDSATWLKDFITCVIKFVMGTPVQPCAEDDPRLRGFPCFGRHKPKERQNQFASWSTCLACGLRLSYCPKKGSHGEDRHMGPHPHLIKMAMDQIESSMPKEQVNEKLVNGKLMELKGLQLQHGLTNTMAVNMTYAQYMKRMGFKEESSKKIRSPSPSPKRAPSKPSQEQMETKMLEAAAGYLKKEGLDNLDAQKFETAVRDAVRKEMDAQSAEWEFPEAAVQVVDSDQDEDAMIQEAKERKDP